MALEPIQHRDCHSRRARSTTRPAWRALACFRSDADPQWPTSGRTRRARANVAGLRERRGRHHRRRSVGRALALTPRRPTRSRAPRLHSGWPGPDRLVGTTAVDLPIGRRDEFPERDCHAARRGLGDRLQRRFAAWHARQRRVVAIEHGLRRCQSISDWAHVDHVRARRAEPHTLRGHADRHARCLRRSGRHHWRLGYSRREQPASR